MRSPSPRAAERIVVTGGAGFIGSHLVERLLAEGGPDREVVVFDNLGRGQPEVLAGARGQRTAARLTVLQGDVRDAPATTRACADASVIYHLAAVHQDTADGNATSPDDLASTNVSGTLNVLRAADRAGARRVVFASSWEVYGDPLALPVPEDAPLLAASSAGASKIAAEAFCRAYRREAGLDVAVLRLAQVYGPRDSGTLFPTWLERADRGADLDVPGGKQIADFVWVGQVVEALVCAATYEFPLPPVNVGSGTGTRLLDAARRVAQLANRPGQISIGSARPQHGARFVANVERMRQLLGVEPPLDPLGHLPSLLPARAA